MWEAVEASTGEVGMGEAKGRGSKGKSWEKERRKGEKENEKGEDDGGKENSGGIGNMGRRRGSSKVRSGSKEAGIREVS